MPIPGAKAIGRLAIRPGNILTPDVLEALFVFGRKNVAVGSNAGTAAIGEDAGIHRQDVGHGKEGPGRSGKFVGEFGAAFLELEEPSDEGAADLLVD